MRRERDLMSAYGLSKSKFLSGMQCPKRLYLDVHHPEWAEEESDAASKFLTGYQVGEVARQLSSPGKTVGCRDNVSEAVEETRQWLALSPEVPISEATLVHPGALWCSVRSCNLAKATTALRPFMDSLAQDAQGRTGDAETGSTTRS
jgi:hypothetical protein